MTFIWGLAMLAIGSNFLYGIVRRGKSPIRVRLLGIAVPLRLIQAAAALLLLGCGMYLIFGGRFFG
ncbi:hypothetical protein CDO73_23115 [Saccharibacillus sp. O23]|uniref:hypothetical protein n=1 Tax=Saccharibacillus sp. O23 TaxID=2009338 RepID=UPI000B4E4D02|nr:hypothetical protein [Saccharibacillus sp. O23]OWR27144.1 hypothetical protein CDO73_23115 [Saccharibacillus sp. O23]